jgi:hypothetical protein
MPGSFADAPVTDPTVSASDIALLKGILTRLGLTVSVAVTPTLTVHATYISGDYVGTSGVAMIFAGMGRVNGGTVTLFPAALIDYAAQSVATELWLFDTAITPPADSAAWSISDADSAHCVAVLPFSTYYASALNAIALSANSPIPVKCAAADTALYGCLVTRGAPAYADGDVTIKLRGVQD